MGSQKRALNFLILCFGIWICMSITEAKPATSEVNDGDNVLHGLKGIEQLKDERILHDDEEDTGNLLLTDENEEGSYESSDLDEDGNLEVEAATPQDTVDGENDGLGGLHNLSATENGVGGPRNSSDVKTYVRSSSSDSDSNEIRISLLNLDRVRNYHRGKDGKRVKRTPSESSQSHHSGSSTDENSSYSNGKSSHHSSIDESSHSDSKESSHSDSNESGHLHSNESDHSHSNESDHTHSNNNSHSHSKESSHSHSNESGHSDSNDSDHSDSNDSDHSDSNESYLRRRRGFCGLNYKYTKVWSRFLRKLRKRVPEALRPLAFPVLDLEFLDRVCKLVRKTFIQWYHN